MYGRLLSVFVLVLLLNSVALYAQDEDFERRVSVTSFAVDDDSEDNYYRNPLVIVLVVFILALLYVIIRVTASR